MWVRGVSAKERQVQSISRQYPPLGCNVMQDKPNARVVVSKGAGQILCGAPPEVIKHFRRGGGDMPEVVVLASEFYKRGQVQNEVSFIVASNFFMGGHKKTAIIGTAEQIARARIILEEEFFGPKENVPEQTRREMEHFRFYAKLNKYLTLDDMVEFVVLSEGREINFKGCTIKSFGNGQYRFVEGKMLGEVDTQALASPILCPPTFHEFNFRLPRFGLTFFGTSSGFDALNRTTSLMLWVDGQGLFIDPLDMPQIEMVKLGIDPNKVKTVFLTHCHADHDVGVLDMVLNQGATLITSSLVYQSFLTRAVAYTGEGIDSLRSRIHFIPAEPGMEIDFNGAKLEISSAFHAVPTIRFVARYAGKTIAYSGDTLFDPAQFEVLQSTGVLTMDRRRELEGFVYNSKANLFAHEAYIVPLHTSDLVLQALPYEIRKNMRIVHTGTRSPGVTIPLARAGETFRLAA
ncbi:MAG: MBL fold metallo-hydrolase [Candidatus Saganbacteria bacterium]|nr:MBL fold metallo-hydrolase [Candidatus Saganbacteria bacterium]